MKFLSSKNLIIKRCNSQIKLNIYSNSKKEDIPKPTQMVLNHNMQNEHEFAARVFTQAKLELACKPEYSIETLYFCSIPGLQYIQFIDTKELNVKTLKMDTNWHTEYIEIIVLKCSELVKLLALCICYARKFTSNNYYSPYKSRKRLLISYKCNWKKKWN